MTMAEHDLSAWAPAKVNLYLHVGPPKENGRHDLDSLVVFADMQAADHLGVSLSDELSLDVSGSSAQAAGNGADNLVLRAALALQAASGCQKGARLSLEKRLPVAAGIGGGSSDAAAALRLLTQLWAIDPAHARAVAPGLGGDVPVALLGVPSLMQGEGERVTQVEMSFSLPALLINPGVACPTGPVFQDHDAAGGGQEFAEITALPAFKNVRDLSDWLTGQRNDLEAPAIVRVPEIGDVLDFLRNQNGGLLTRMSGSGATCFALFETIAQAQAAQDLLKKETRRSHWWSAACHLGSAP